MVAYSRAESTIYERTCRSAHSLLRTGVNLRDMNRRHFLSMLGAAPLAAQDSTKRKPNVILVLLDDLGWSDFGIYGSKYYETPELDRLAREGVRFTQAYAACPVCSPTRASIMTGKYPARLHLTDWIPGRKIMPDQSLLRPNFRLEL